MAGNPLSLSRQRTKHAAPRITRYLEPSIWQEVKDTIAAMPRDTDRARAHAYRVRWLFTLLYLGGLRIAEVGANTMGQFFVRRDADGAMRWWLTVHGKGGKERLVPATREMMTELSRYRQQLGLSALPSPNEETPLVLPIGATAANDRSADVRAADARRTACDRQRRICGGGCATSRREMALRRAQTYWRKRRPTGCGTAPARTWPIKEVDLRLVRDNLGHASLTTTSLYLHIDDDRRHQETEDKHRIDW